MDDFTEKNLHSNCPHCDPTSFALKYPLEETDNFWIVCDVHPLIEGHVLIIPKKHLSCIGEYPKQVYAEFLPLFQKFSDFIRKTYGAVSTFEHGKIGQTVFHSHVHVLPFSGSPFEIIPEGLHALVSFGDFSHLKDVYQKKRRYLYFSISHQKWTVDTKLGAPGFFRGKFANALHVPERGNWKDMNGNKNVMEKAAAEIEKLQNKWNSFKR